MKYFTRFIIFVFIVYLTSLTSCRTMRTSEKEVSESETASVTASRLTFYRTIDSLSKQFRMSADSIIMIFASSPEFPSAFSSGMEGHLETLSDSQSTQQIPRVLPQSLKIYGLHIADDSKEKSVTTSDLKDSVTVTTQSQKVKSAKKQSSKPSSAPYFILIIGIITFAIYVVYCIKRFI